MPASSLNHAYKLIWSHVLNAWVAVSEITKGKSKSQKAAAILSSALFAGFAGFAGFSGFALAEPTGGVVTSGSGTINQTGTTTTINQSSQTLNLNWNTFNVGSKETVNFIQPSATALAVNRILDTNGSRIMGNINANGQVWLINPNGVYFGSSATINVGSLLASTLNPLSNTTDTTQVFGNGGTGSVTNAGTINAADGGYVALIANTVSNTGTITANTGTVALGAGSQVSVTFADNQLLSLTVDKSTLNNLAENKGLLQANGGVVLLSAGAKDSLLASVVNNEGVIEAKTVDHQAGKIILMGGMTAGTTKVAGTLDASAETGDGGFIETSAATVDLTKAHTVTTLATQGETGTWLIDPNDFTIAASGGNITGAQLSTDLASNNITISTATQGTAGGNGDIFVKSNVTWSSGRTLTLNAERNINVLATIDASQGSGGKVALFYGQGSTDGTINGTQASYNFGLTGSGFTGKINLQAGNNFSTKLGSSGTTTDYTVITSLGLQGSTTGTDLQGINGNLSGNYVLGDDIDASATSTWNSNAGFSPIGSNSTGDITTRFTGKFDGLGHTINNLTINRPSTSYIGLFGYLNNASIRNIGLVGGDITGKSYVGSLAGRIGSSTTQSVTDVYSTAKVSGYSYIGGLAGYSSGTTFNNVFATGDVSSESDTDGFSYAGGLLGSSLSTKINNSYATGNVTASGDNVGGLVGRQTAGSLSNVYASGDVFSTGSDVGGLVGYVNAVSGISILNAFATGNVSAGEGAVGGLIGSLVARITSPATLKDSYATGNVSANGDDVGGLIGHSENLLATNVYANGDVSGYKNVGGLVGYTIAVTLNNVYADGKVTGVNKSQDVTAYASAIGGLVGNGFDTDIENSYSNATVSGELDVGGLIGRLNGGELTNVHAEGDVQGTYNIGGLVGSTSSPSIKYYNSGSAYYTGAVSINNAYATGLVSADSNAGGLVGVLNSTDVQNVHATGNVNCADSACGGLVGMAKAGSVINNAYATGDVTASQERLYGYSIGGLVGDNAAVISNAYATGKVTGNVSVGGLVGNNTSSITNAYATGVVDGNDSQGGLVGYNTGTISNSFYSETTGQSDTGKGLKKTAAEMKQLSTFSAWDISNVGGDGTVWRIYEGQTAPLLRSFLTQFNLTPDYDGSATTQTNIGSVSTPAGADTSKVLGTQTGNSLTLTSPNAGSYIATADITGLFSTQQGYDLSATRTITTAGSAAGDITLANGVSWTNGTLNINGNVTNAGAIISSNGIFNLVGGTWSQLGALANFSVKDFRISGGTFMRFIDGDGTSADPYEIADIYGLQGVGSTGMLDDHYTLANNIDASGTTYWNSGAGFDPLGNNSTNSIASRFTGKFDGLNHTINNLTINRPTTDYIGLFGSAENASISNIGLVGGSITGGDYVGGLVGANTGTIGNSYATGEVTGGYFVGGLVGENFGTISNSYATGAVTGTSGYVGGLVGENFGTISISYATGAVTGTGAFVGGLVGENFGTISNACAIGAVTGTDIFVGGLVGENFGTISNSYATGAVTGEGFAGGLVGINRSGTISNAYATGAVTGSANVGGLVGYSQLGSISNSYATGAVTGTGSSFTVGGLVGFSQVATISNSFYSETTGQSDTGKGIKKTVAEMKQLSTFSAWDISNVGGDGTVWRIYEGQTSPLLRSFLTTANLGTTTVTYNGNTQDASSATTSLNSAHVLGSAANGYNAGTYTSSNYSDQQGYDFEGGDLVITPATLTYVATPTSIIQGQTPSLTGAVTGFVSGEDYASVLGNQTALWTSPDAKLTTAGVYSVVGSGLTASNYSFVQAAGNATALTVKAGTSETITLLQQVHAGPPAKGSSSVTETNSNQVSPSSNGETGNDEGSQDGNALTGNNNVNLIVVAPGVNLPPSIAN